MNENVITKAMLVSQIEQSISEIKKEYHQYGLQVETLATIGVGKRFGLLTDDESLALINRVQKADEVRIRLRRGPNANKTGKIYFLDVEKRHGKIRVFLDETGMSSTSYDNLEFI